MEIGNQTNRKSNENKRACMERQAARINGWILRTLNSSWALAHGPSLICDTCAETTWQNSCKTFIKLPIHVYRLLYRPAIGYFFYRIFRVLSLRWWLHFLPQTLGHLAVQYLLVDDRISLGPVGGPRAIPNPRMFAKLLAVIFFVLYCMKDVVLGTSLSFGRSCVKLWFQSAIADDNINSSIQENK